MLIIIISLKHNGNCLSWWDVMWYDAMEWSHIGSIPLLYTFNTNIEIDTKIFQHDTMDYDYIMLCCEVMSLRSNLSQHAMVCQINPSNTKFQAWARVWCRCETLSGSVVVVIILFITEYVEQLTWAKVQQLGNYIHNFVGDHQGRLELLFTLVYFVAKYIC